MPELPEVETVRKGLEKRLKDFYIGRIEVLKERSIASNGGSKGFINNVKDSYFGDWGRRGREEERERVGGGGRERGRETPTETAHVERKSGHEDEGEAKKGPRADESGPRAP